MPTEDENAAQAAKDDAEFEAGFPAERAPGAAPPEVATEPAGEKPEYVQISAKEWGEIKAAALSAGAKLPSYDQQLSKAFGTIGNLQKLVQGLQAPSPSARKVEVPKAAFERMAKDFPELADQMREAMETVLAGAPVGPAGGTIGADPDQIQQMLAAHVSKKELEALEDAYPDWRALTGAVDASREQPDPNHPFRKWLGAQDAAYQAKVNSTESASVMSRAIKKFQTDTRIRPAPAAATPRNDARAERIRDAVQPRGDNARAPAGKTADEEFEAGFNSR
jgi:hypothetical protein